MANLIRRCIFNASLILTSVAVTGILVEIGLRVFFAQGGPPLIHQFDPRLGYRLVRNLSFTHVWDGHESVGHIQTGPQGFRDTEVSVVESTGEFRILLLGDSYTFGYGVDGNDTFAKRLERSLNSVSRGRYKRFLVINAGVIGYGTTQEMLQYELIGKTLRPDIVVLNFFIGNDIQDNLCLNYETLKPHRRSPCFSLENNILVQKSGPMRPDQTRKTGSSTFFSEFLSQLAQTELFKLVLQRSKLLVANPLGVRLLQSLGVSVHPGYLPHVVEGWYFADRLEYGWPLTRKLLQRLDDEVKENGAKLAVVAIPSRVQVLPELFKLTSILYPDVAEVQAFLENPSKPQQMLMGFLAQQGIAALDLGPLLQQHPEVDELYGPFTAHWNRAGHRVAAGAIEQFLEHEGLIPGVERGTQTRAQEQALSSTLSVLKNHLKEGRGGARSD